MISLEKFLALPTKAVAQLVRQAGPQVCVIPINGTRRWVWLEHRAEITSSSDPLSTYIELAGREYVRLFMMLFEHGIDTILSPVFGSELLMRGDAYVRAVLGKGVRQFVESPTFTDFYNSCGVRARFYGHLTRLINTPYEDVLSLANTIVENTKLNSPYRLFIGIFADDPTEQTAIITLQYYQKYNTLPDRAAIIKEFYGEAVEPATFFIGFDKPTVYDYPLLATGRENLYFTYAPSPYLDTNNLKIILYDHLFTRQVNHTEWEKMPSEVINSLRDYYHFNQSNIQGVGRLLHNTWIPF